MSTFAELAKTLEGGLAAASRIDTNGGENGSKSGKSRRPGAKASRRKTGKIDEGQVKERTAMVMLRQRYGDPYLENKDGNIEGFNARFWAAVVRDESLVVYEPDIGCFWTYDPGTGLYSRQTHEAIREMVGARLFRAATDEKSPVIKKLVSVGKLDSIVKAAVGIAERREFFADRPKAIHLANGMVLEDKGHLVFEEGFSPVYRSRNQSPFSFRSGASCNRFLEELLVPMLPDPGDRLTFQKWLGLTLSGDNPAQRILLLDGTPARGKGVLQRIATGLIGRQNSTELRTPHLGERFELNRFVGKTLLQASDVPGDFLMQKWASVLKSIVGGDYMDTEVKGGNEAHEITGNFNVLIVSNTRLRCRLDGDAGAWKRRLVILRTDSPPVKNRIPNFEEVLLREEGDGILQWALEGYQLALKDINETGDIILSQKQIGRVDALLAESESLKIFIRDRIRRTTDFAATTVDEILKAFAEFCADRGWMMPPQAVVLRELPDQMLHFHQAAKSNSVKTMDGTRRGFRGVEIVKPG